MRTLVVWCPDWPVTAAISELGHGTNEPAVVLADNRVIAGNQRARDEGIRRGLRRRDAQARCPGVLLLDDNPDRDLRCFEPVLAAVERLRPGVAPLRPGLLAIRSPGRYYGSEEHAAAVIAEHLVAAGVTDLRIGVADDLFTAEQAARQTESAQEWRIVPAGGSAVFLGGLRIDVLPDAELVSLLRRLGIDTLGEFAALPHGTVLTRFGGTAAKIHRLAGGTGQATVSGRTPPPDLETEVSFEPPLASVEAVAFSVRTTAERFVHRLGEGGEVATAVRIEAESDDAERSLLSSRVWLHSGWFTAADLVDRVHWQLRATPAGKLVGAPVALVRFVPETVEPAAAHADGLWSGGDERVDRGVARVQAMLGYDSVSSPVRQGGRTPADRQRLVPWGERATGLRPTERPWPGSIPPPAPSVVYREPRTAEVVDQAGRTVAITGRGAVTGDPVRFRIDAGSTWRHVVSWAGPWPADERWWERPAGEGPSGPVARFQLVGTSGDAWLLRCDAGRWVTEASYD